MNAPARPRTGDVVALTPRAARRRTGARTAARRLAVLARRSAWQAVTTGTPPRSQSSVNGEAQ